MTATIKDKTSIEWIAIKEHCENRLAEMRAENDNDADITETAKLRGRIEFCKEILDLEKNEQKVNVSDTTYIE
jgi:hypothetical protein